MFPTFFMVYPYYLENYFEHRKTSFYTHQNYQHCFQERYYYKNLELYFWWKNKIGNYLIMILLRSKPLEKSKNTFIYHKLDLKKEISSCFVIIARCQLENKN